MTYECLYLTDLMTFKQITGFAFGFLSDNFIELVNSHGQSFFWVREAGESLFCIVE